MSCLFIKSTFSLEIIYGIHIYYISDLIERHINFDQWEFCVVWAMHISFLDVLSAVPPSSRGIARGLTLYVINCQRNVTSHKPCRNNGMIEWAKSIVTVSSSAESVGENSLQNITG
jgi:hypothetical protein